MTDSVGTVVPETVVKKPRKPRSASQYLVLRAEDASENQTAAKFEIVAQVGTVKAAVKRIRTDKITGQVIIACVRRAYTVKTSESITLERA